VTITASGNLESGDFTSGSVTFTITFDDDYDYSFSLADVILVNCLEPQYALSALTITIACGPTYTNSTSLQFLDDRVFDSFERGNLATDEFVINFGANQICSFDSLFFIFLFANLIV
jgi:hypothetical protein